MLLVNLRLSMSFSSILWLLALKDLDFSDWVFYWIFEAFFYSCFSCSALLKLSFSREYDLFCERIGSWLLLISFYWFFSRAMPNDLECLGVRSLAELGPRISSWGTFTMFMTLSTLQEGAVGGFLILWIVYRAVGYCSIRYFIIKRAN